MNGFIKRTATVLCLGGATVLGGCCQQSKLSDCYDQCWLERYSALARQSELEAFTAQVNNGHVLDQTVFTYHFVPGTDELTKGGIDHLAYLVRRRPEPDTKVYVQTAQDVTFDPARPEDFTNKRNDLNAKRVEAVQRYLNVAAAGRPLVFTVMVHDAPTPGLPSVPFKGSPTAKVFYNDYGRIVPATSSGTIPTGGGGM